MRRRAFLTGAAALAAASYLASPARAAPRRFEDVLHLLKQASPTGYRIIAGQMAAPTQFQVGDATVTISKVDPATWLDRFPPDRLVMACNTMVHETCHAFCRLKALSMGVLSPGLAVFPSVQETVLVRGTDSFPSADVGPSMLAELRDTTRFETYIAAAGSNHATQQSGIYGLLNEFSAYYVGNQTAYDLIVHMAKAPESDGWAWLEHISGLTGTVTAHQEFRGFILSYLHFARKNKPRMFAELMSNKELLEAFVSINEAHAALCRRWFAYLPELVARLNDRGTSMVLRGEHVFYKNSGRGLAISEYREIERAIDADPALRAIQQAL